MTKQIEKTVEKKSSKVICVQPYHSPCGDLMLGSYDDRICLCNWTAGTNKDKVDKRLQKLLKSKYEEKTTNAIRKAVEQLDEYFGGRRTVFDLPLLFVGTDFQKRVWEKLLEIPYGTTVSYGEQAKRLGCSKSVRAVANANGANAISIIVPCHRVIGGDNSLTGYGGGLPAKKILLDLEKT